MNYLFKSTIGKVSISKIPLIEHRTFAYRKSDQGTSTIYEREAGYFKQLDKTTQRNLIENKSERKIGSHYSAAQGASAAGSRACGPKQVFRVVFEPMYNRTNACRRYGSFTNI